MQAYFFISSAAQVSMIGWVWKQTVNIIKCVLCLLTIPIPLKIKGQKVTKIWRFLLPNLTLCASSFTRRQIFRKQATCCQSRIIFSPPKWPILVLSAVRCPVRVSFTLLTVFAALQSDAVCEWKWKKHVVGSSVAKWLTSPRRLVMQCFLQLLFQNFHPRLQIDMYAGG